jgi:hypothetical protein
MVSTLDSERLLIVQNLRFKVPSFKVLVLTLNLEFGTSNFC